MIKKILLYVIGSLGLLFFISAKAALNLELTQGVNAALPIIIVPFADEQKNVPGDTTITAVMTNDLQNSGQFRVIKPGFLASKPSTLAEIDFEKWKKQGANDIVIGQVKPTGNAFQVSFQLISVYSKQVLLNQSFTSNEAGLRGLAHHLSDMIYQKLTGVPGVFSTKIAYILVQRGPGEPGYYSLEVADADGFNPRTLLRSTLPIMSPTWSPNGQEIAYVSFEKHEAAIYLQNIYTGQRTRISAFPGINGAPAFSPDGKELALVLTRTGNPKIYLMNLTKKRLTQITHGYSIDTEPAFAPDGKSLIFTSNRGGTPQIYRYTFADKQITRLTFSGNYNARSAYLPSEQSIVMMHRQDDMFGIARQSLQTGRVTVLVQTGSDESPSLAPNGKMVLYATEYGGRGVLAMVSTDGRIKLRLPARNGNVQEPAWSPYLAS